MEKQKAHKLNINNTNEFFVHHFDSFCAYVNLCQASLN